MRIVKKNLRIFAVIVFTFLFGEEQDTRGFIVKVGDDCPPFKAELINESTITLDSLLGEVTLIQFTASWCSVCRVEMPHIEKEIWQIYRAKGLNVIGVDRDEPLEVVKEFAKTMKITYPLALDPGANVFSLFAERNSGVTRNIVIDKSGKIAFLTRLYNPIEFQEMIGVIDRLLKE